MQLPAESFDFVTWDPVLKQTPNRGWRRWGTHEARRHDARSCCASTATPTRRPRACWSATSRAATAASSARRYGGLGHATHQNGLDVDVYYPRKDGLERAARRPSQVDRALAQDLVDRFVDAGAIRIYVGPQPRACSGRRRVVSPLVYHDDHLHVRLSPRRVNDPVAG